jgi:2-keto-4-pentenoate hydratase
MSESPADAVIAGMRRGHLDTESLKLPGDDLHLGLETQLEVLKRWIDAGEQLGGWKIGLTSRTARDRMGKRFRPFGHILAGRILRDGSPVDRSRISDCLIEPELCFTLGSDLGGPNVEATTARRAVESVAPAFEIIERRIPPGASPAVSLADDMAQWGIVVGGERSVAADDPTPSLVELWEGSQCVTAVDPRGDVDDHFESMAAVCRSLAAHGMSLITGQRVITGSLTPPSPVRAPGTWRANLHNIGDVSVTFI